MLTSVEVGLGGAWLFCPPQLLFVPDRDGDDVPDGPAEVVLDGFTVPAENYHNFANGLQLGPRRLALRALRRLGPRPRSVVPGTPDADRVPLDGGLWRFHPKTKRVRGARPRHDEPLGPRLERPRRGVLHQHRQRPPLARRSPGCTSSAPTRSTPTLAFISPIDQHADHCHWDNAQGLERLADPQRRARPARAAATPTAA